MNLKAGVPIVHKQNGVIFFYVMLIHKLTPSRPKNYNAKLPTNFNGVYTAIGGF
jgi:hypothetical protein